jgi:hypothetical protein
MNTTSVLIKGACSILAYGCSLITCCTAYSQKVNAIKLYVSNSGRSKGTGSISDPFLSPDDALKFISTIKGPLDATIYFKAGTFNFSRSLTITSSSVDSTKHLTFAAYNNEKVVFSGGAKLPNKDFEIVKDAEILNRLPAVARGKVYSIDLRKLGISDYGRNNPHGYKNHLPSNLELFYNGAVQILARWPNKGLAPIGKILDPGPNHSKGEGGRKGPKFIVTGHNISGWATARDAWITGLLSFGWSDDNLRVDSVDLADNAIRLKDAADYAAYSSSDSSTGLLKNSHTIRGYYIYNLLEEIDEPGEWYLDRTIGVLYVWPPDNSIGSADLEVSLLEDPVIILSNLSNVTIQGISFGCSRGVGILLEHTNNTTIKNCLFDGLGTVAIYTGRSSTPQMIQYSSSYTSANNRYNTNLSIQSCVIRNTGTGGVIMDGGDRRTLTRANNTIKNCEIYNYSRIDKTYSPAIYLNGVGNHVNHCYIHDAPDAAIIFYGNDHDISYNHIANVLYNIADGGAVNTGRDLLTTGTKITFNYFENIANNSNSSICSVYLDDGSSGMEVSNNVFYKSVVPGTYHLGAIHVNGGTDNIFNNNYFIDCEHAFSNTQWTDSQFKSLVTDSTVAKAYRQDLDIHSPLFVERYPHLAKFANPDALAPRTNYSYNSLAYNVPVFSSGAGYTHNNVFITTQNPGFASLTKPDFTLVNLPDILKQNKDWKPIPFNSIGLKK